MTLLNGTQVGAVIASICWVVMASSPAYGQAAEERALHRFQHAVNTYVALHRDLERSFPALEVTDDMEGFYQNVDELANRIRQARRNPQEGIVFDAEVGRILRSRIHTLLRDQQIDVFDILTDILEEPPADSERPQINERFPWIWASAVPRCVWGVLPEVPEELEYRFAGFDLVLIDIHAELVVDILRDALPPLLPRGILTSGPSDAEVLSN